MTKGGLIPVTNFPTFITVSVKYLRLFGHEVLFLSCEQELIPFCLFWVGRICDGLRLSC